MKKYLVIACCAGVLLLVVGLHICFPRKYVDIINKASAKYGLDRSVIMAIINIESGFEKDKVSYVGAEGLMQIMPATGVECGMKLGLQNINLFDVESNIEIGCYYVNYLLEVFDGNIKNSLCAYNWGMGNVANWLNGGNIDENGNIINVPIKETRDYWTKFVINKWVYSCIWKY